MARTLQCPQNDLKPTLSSTSLVTMSERGGPLAQEHIYNYRSGWRQRTSGKPRTAPCTLDARTLFLNVGAALLAKPANLSEFSKRH
jgi:hypothetical protein